MAIGDGVSTIWRVESIFRKRFSLPLIKSQGEEMDNQIKSLTAYLNFTGNCEEALNHYAKIFAGKVTVANRYDNPAMIVPKEFDDKILHATLEFFRNMLRE